MKQIGIVTVFKQNFKFHCWDSRKWVIFTQDKFNENIGWKMIFQSDDAHVNTKCYVKGKSEKTMCCYRMDR